MDSVPHPDAVIRLTPRAEQQFQCEAERIGGYATDRDEAAMSTAAYNFLQDCGLILVAVRA